MRRRRAALRRWARWRCCWRAPQLACGAGIVGVRVWPAPDYTRVTIESDGPLTATHFLTSGPDRLVIDLDGLELSPQLRELVGKVRPDDPYIAGVRVGQFQAARGAPGDRPEAGRGAAAVHADAGGGLPAPAGVRPVPDAGQPTRCWR